MNPFNPLITTVEFKTKVGDTSSDNTKAEAFLNMAYQMFVSFGLPYDLTGNPKTMVEECSINNLGGFLSESWEYNGKIGKNIILLKQPILSLTSIKLKNQNSNPPQYSSSLYLGDFLFKKYDKFLETAYSSWYPFSRAFWSDSSYTYGNNNDIAQVTYITGVENTDYVKFELLQALFLIYLDTGYRAKPAEGLNQARVIRQKADDVDLTFDYSAAFTAQNYIENNDVVANILEPFKGNTKHVF